MPEQRDFFANGSQLHYASVVHIIVLHSDPMAAYHVPQTRIDGLSNPPSSEADTPLLIHEGTHAPPPSTTITPEAGSPAASSTPEASIIGEAPEIPREETALHLDDNEAQPKKGHKF